MKLTIMVDGSSIGKNGVFFNDIDISSCAIPNNVWALQWNNSSGHIEFNNEEPNEEITSLPQWAVNCSLLWDQLMHEQLNPPDDVLIQRNKDHAEYLLTKSDWTMLPDVTLLNKEDWIKYRKQLRTIALSPSLSVVFPEEPQEIWE